MLPSLDPSRVRARNRRLGAALAVSAALHVAFVGLWLWATPAVPEVPVLPVVEYAVSDVVAIPEVAMLPDAEFGETPSEAGGGAAPGQPDRPPAEPPPAMEAPAIVAPSRAAPTGTNEAVSRAGPARSSAVTPSATAPDEAPRMASPGAPTSGPPGGVPGGRGTAGSGGTPGGSGTGAGSGAGTGQGDGPGGPGAGDRFVERPEQSPRSNGLAFAVYPEEARRAGVKARARVRVLVGSDRRALSVEIVERTLIDRRGREQAVATLPYGMEEAVLTAARGTGFSAARDGGEVVRAYANVTISIGVDR